MNNADSPVIHCYPGSAYVHDTMVDIKCTIDAHPAPSVIFWIIDENGTMLAENEVKDEMWILITDVSEIKCIYTILCK